MLHTFRNSCCMARVTQKLSFDIRPSKRSYQYEIVTSG